jgi:hypothetical protein
MGLFTKARRPAVSLVWQPVKPAFVGIIPGRETDDDGCAGDRAYGVTFTLASAPRSWIAAAFYAVYGAEDKTFVLGARYEYRVYDAAGHVTWNYTGWEGDASGDWFCTLSDADRAARGLAEVMASRTGAARWEFLEWDGQPW